MTISGAVGGVFDGAGDILADRDDHGRFAVCDGRRPDRPVRRCSLPAKARSARYSGRDIRTRIFPVFGDISRRWRSRRFLRWLVWFGRSWTANQRKLATNYTKSTNQIQNPKSKIRNQQSPLLLFSSSSSLRSPSATRFSHTFMFGRPRRRGLGVWDCVG